MDYSVIMSGFGGQGVLMMGELLAHTGMKAGLNVTWMPSYGVEMRGGTANCTVMLSDEPIGAPLTGQPRAVIAMSGPALEKFGPALGPDGLLLINSSMIKENKAASSNGVKRYFIPSLDLARTDGNEKMANITMLGAFVASSGLLQIEEVAREVESFLPSGKKALAAEIIKALHRGGEYINSIK